MKVVPVEWNKIDGAGVYRWKLSTHCHTLAEVCHVDYSDVFCWGADKFPTLSLAQAAVEKALGVIELEP